MTDKSTRQRRKERQDHKFRVQFHSVERVNFIKQQSCDTCGAPPPSDPSHHPSRGAGGTFRDLFPQCRRCHSRMHQRGVDTFLAKIHRTRGWLTSRTAYWEREWRRAA